MYGYDQWAVSIVTPPATEPVSVAEARANGRIDGENEDDLIAMWIQAAREWVEGYLWRSLVTQTVRLSVDSTSCGRVMELPRGPVQSIVAFRYDDLNGDEQIFDSAAYRLDAVSDPARLILRSQYAWPWAGSEGNAVRVDYVVGYGAAAAVPASIRAAILLIVGDLYEHREAKLEVTANENPAVLRLLDRYRVREFG